MRITRLHIENFRSIRAVDIELAETTVFIGPNNAGKTAILDAIRIALTRRWGQRGTGFTEYDIHLPNEDDDPKQSSGIVIEIHIEEQTVAEWPEALLQNLDEISQIDPTTGLNSIKLRVNCAWSEEDSCYQPSWTFLNAARTPLVGLSARRTNLERFWQYMPVFYLSALRDVNDEFSSHSQFWGRLLKEMEIPEALESRTKRVLNLLNQKLLKADPRLEEITETLSGVTQIAASDREGGVNIQLIPNKASEILSKAQIILRNETDRPWLPLQNHGQGIQSLSVIFLFQAFVQHLLEDLYEAESSPLLALEEPETHLHPQAARTLWNHIRVLAGQKCITTHSPYFVQHVPFRDMRLVRLGANGTEVSSLPANFSVNVPHNAQLDTCVTNSHGLLSYTSASQKLTVNGELSQPVYRSLLTCYVSAADRAAVHPLLRQLYSKSKIYVSNQELVDLETFALRIRGEIFFARRWFLVEGQAEYLLITALARALDYDLDANGVSLIDAQNNGNPVTFAVVARALNIPWVAVFDGDQAGHGYVASIRSRHFDAPIVAARCAVLPAGDLEAQLVADGLIVELRHALNELGLPNAVTIASPQLEEALRHHKTEYAEILARRLNEDAALAPRMPQAFRNAITLLRTLI